MGYQTNTPARVQAALDFLEHCRYLTDQSDPAVPVRSLSPLEDRVSRAALEVLCTYFTGEMDYGDAPPRRDVDDGDDDGAVAPEPVPTR